MATPTLEQWLANARAQLQQAVRDSANKGGNESHSATLDVQLLLCHVLGQSRTYLYTWGDKTLSPEQLKQADELLAQRLAGQPIAYLLGEREFWSLPLKVAPSTLIPRADTETLIEWVLDLAAEQQLPAAQANSTFNALDLGTGTGAIALALASEFPNWKVTGVDFQPQAVELAQSNGADLKLNNASFKHSDWFSALAGQCFELIVSNPPYIDGDDPHLSQGDVRFEPHTALVADDQGLADLALIIDQAPEYLASGGWLLLEHGYQQADAVCDLLKQRGFTEVENRRDLGGQPRISGGRWFS